MGENFGSQMISFFGMIVILALAVLLSRNRRKIQWKVVLAGLGLQFIFALLVLKTSPGRWFFSIINEAVVQLLKFTVKGSSFVFGGLVSDVKTFGFIFAFQVLPTIVFFSSLMSILYYLGIMQKVVQIVAKVIIKIMGTSGAETLSASASIFVGQTEAPLLIRPYIESLTQSELLAVMIAGFAHISGGVMAAYVGMLNGCFPDVAGHMLTACVISTPGALMMAKILLPETEEPKTLGSVHVDLPKTDANVIDAAANGAGIGMQLAINVGAMLMAFIALIAMCNFGVEKLGDGINAVFGTHMTLNLETIFGVIFAPVAWILGVPWKDCLIVGNLLGKMLVINEFVAYSELADILRNAAGTLSPRSVVIATYALCGFANLSSIAIQIGGIGSLAPSRRPDLARLGVLALLAGTLTNYMTAAIAGFLVPTTTINPPPAAPRTMRSTPGIVKCGEFPSREKAWQELIHCRASGSGTHHAGEILIEV